MPKSFRPFVAALLLFAVSAQAAAQAPQPKPQKKPSKAATAAAEADPLAEVRRTTAISLVTSLADEARDFGNPALRARVQARAADALWETDAERGRALFRRAWDAAEAADEERDRKQEEERQRQIAERGYSSMRVGPSIRSEVVRLAAKRDRALGEEFLAALEQSAKEKAESATSALREAERKATPPRARDAQETPPAVAQRLGLARQLLEDGDVDRAVQFADPALSTVTAFGMDFLARLRPRNAKAADERFAALLARVAVDPSADANTVSLLSSYLFTPSLYMTFDTRGGSNSSSYGTGLVAPADAERLRPAFFTTAAAVLLRPSPPVDQDQTTAGRAGTLMVITRLLPLFEQHAPDRAAALRTKLAALMPDAPEGITRGNNALTRGLVPEDPNRDRVQETLDRLAGAKDAGERDAVYADAAMVAVGKKDPRAAEFIDKVEDLDIRRQLRNYLDFEMLDEAVRKNKDAQEILRLARAGELTSTQRAWALTEAARLLARSEPGRAAELLDEATAEARKIDAASPDRVRALVAVATQLVPLDRARLWELMSEVVKAANAQPEFTGEDAIVEVSLKTKFSTNRRTTSVEAFDLAGLFTALAAEDLDRAVELARSFKAEHPRAAATLAVARSVLVKKPDDKGRRADAR